MAASGVEPPEDPDEADVVRDLGGMTLAMAGGQLSAEDQHVLNAFAAQVAAAAEAQRLHLEADKAGELAAANDLRAALLQAVSHDLRTPLASIKASISSLRQHEIDWPPDTESRVQGDDRGRRPTGSTALVGNLLDMSRLQASAVVADLRPTGVEEVVVAAIGSLGAGAPHVDVDIDETLPDVLADAALLERALANLVANAGRVSRPDTPARITAGEVGGDQHHIDIQIIDRGPGIRVVDRDLVFQPFQRIVDHHGSGAGVGLGLAIARGFVEAMGGELAVEDTPGGGTTMVISLPIAASEHS